MVISFNAYGRTHSYIFLCAAAFLELQCGIFTYFDEKFEDHDFWQMFHTHTAYSKVRVVVG